VDQLPPVGTAGVDIAATRRDRLGGGAFHTGRSQPLETVALMDACDLDLLALNMSTGT
jgi:hypothetical protein